jgi:arylsulfatase A-like enzyme
MWDVHYDYAPPPPYDTQFDPDYEGDLTSDDFEKNPRLRPGMPKRDLDHLIALYDGEIRFTDEHLGKIVAELDRLGIADDTIVVVLSDHGDEFFEHGRKGHAQALYDETILIPFVLRYPRRVPAGQRFEGQVRLMDVAPTILGLASIAPPPDFGSRAARDEHRHRDLTPWLTGAAENAPPELVAFSDSRVFGHRKSSVRTATHKLIENGGEYESTELFDLVADPGEQINFAASPNGQVLASQLGTTLTAFTRSVSGRNLATRAKLDADQVERLRALGYVR